MLRYLLVSYHEYVERGWIEKGLLYRLNRLLSVFLKLWYLSIKSITEERGKLLCLRRYLLVYWGLL